jgi:hypothetical protein
VAAAGGEDDPTRSIATSSRSRRAPACATQTCSTKISASEPDRGAWRSGERDRPPRDRPNLQPAVSKGGRYLRPGAAWDPGRPDDPDWGEGAVIVMAENPACANWAASTALAARSRCRSSSTTRMESEARDRYRSAAVLQPANQRHLSDYAPINGYATSEPPPDAVIYRAAARFSTT